MDGADSGYVDRSVLILSPFAWRSFSTAMQGGFVFSTEVLKPNWRRLNPASNVQQLFSLAGFSRILRSLIPAGGDSVYRGQA